MRKIKVWAVVKTNEDINKMKECIYTIVKSKEGSILSVTDQGKFWSITPILIIQILP